MGVDGKSLGKILKYEDSLILIVQRRVCILALELLLRVVSLTPLGVLEKLIIREPIPRAQQMLGPMDNETKLHSSVKGRRDVVTSPKYSQSIDSLLEHSRYLVS